MRVTLGNVTLPITRTAMMGLDCINIGSSMALSPHDTDVVHLSMVNTAIHTYATAVDLVAAGLSKTPAAAGSNLRAAVGDGLVTFGTVALAGGHPLGALSVMCGTLIAAVARAQPAE